MNVKQRRREPDGDKIAALVRRIVEEEAGWQEAYTELFLDVFGGLIKSIAQRRCGDRIAVGAMQSELLLHLRGKDGTWTNLRNFDPGKGAFQNWLWTVVFRLCGTLCGREEIDTEIDPVGRTAGGSGGRFLTMDEWLKRFDGSCEPLLRKIYLHPYYEETPDGIVAEEMGMARETVNRKKKPCLEEFRKFLRKEGLGPSDLDVY